jgi:hypothetical protein
MQVVNAIPQAWKQKLAEDLPTPDLESAKHMQGLLLCTRLIPAENLNSKQIYDIMLRNENHTPTAQRTLQRKFPLLEVKEWKKIYMLHRKVTKHAYSRNFQYKILNNTLYLNKRLSLFGKASTSNCSFCGIHEETVDHLFAECTHAVTLWQGLIDHFSPFLAFPPVSTRSALLGFLDEKLPNFILLNHILLIFKIFVYNCRESKTLSLAALLTRIGKICKLEQKIQEYERSDDTYGSKWNPVINLFP